MSEQHSFGTPVGEWLAAVRAEAKRIRRDDDERRAAEGDEQRDYAEERFNEQLMREV
jgi:hypothetical protein